MERWGFILTGLDSAHCQDISKSSELWFHKRGAGGFYMFNGFYLSNKNRSMELVIIMICV